MPIKTTQTDYRKLSDDALAQLILDNQGLGVVFTSNGKLEGAPNMVILKPALIEAGRRINGVGGVGGNDKSFTPDIVFVDDVKALIDSTLSKDEVAQTTSYPSQTTSTPTITSVATRAANNPVFPTTSVKPLVARPPVETTPTIPLVIGAGYDVSPYGAMPKPTTVTGTVVKSGVTYKTSPYGAMPVPLDEPKTISLSPEERVSINKETDRIAGNFLDKNDLTLSQANALAWDNKIDDKKIETAVLSEAYRAGTAIANAMGASPDSAARARLANGFGVSDEPTVDPSPVVSNEGDRNGSFAQGQIANMMSPDPVVVTSPIVSNEGDRNGSFAQARAANDVMPIESSSLVITPTNEGDRNGSFAQAQAANVMTIDVPPVTVPAEEPVIGGGPTSSVDTTTLPGILAASGVSSSVQPAYAKNDSFTNDDDSWRASRMTSGM